MYVSAISIRLLRGRSTPAMRAIRWVLFLRSALALLVARVLAEHPHDALPPDDLALSTDGFHRCAYFHGHLREASKYTARPQSPQRSARSAPRGVRPGWRPSSRRRGRRPRPFLR